MDTLAMYRDLNDATKLLMRLVDLQGVTAVGETRLLVAVLDRAIKDLEEGEDQGGVLQWLEHPGKGLYSFLSICELLGLNPKSTRALIEKRAFMTRSEQLAA